MDRGRRRADLLARSFPGVFGPTCPPGGALPRVGEEYGSGSEREDSPPAFARRVTDEGEASGSAQAQDSPAASEAADSDDDREWELDLDHPSQYYLDLDETVNSWPSSRPRFLSLLSHRRYGTSSTTDEPRPSTDTTFHFVSMDPEADEEDREDEDDEESGIPFDWVTFFDRPQQEDYTWEQLHPNAARALNIAESLPMLRRAQGIREDLTERAQPLVNSVVLTYNDAAVRVEGAARVANELAIVTGQVSSWLAGEARQRVGALAPIVQAQLPALQARLPTVRARLPVVANLNRAVVLNSLRGGANTVRLHWGIVREGLLEGMRGVAPLENHAALVRRPRRR